MILRPRMAGFEPGTQFVFSEMQVLYNGSGGGEERLGALKIRVK